MGARLSFSAYAEDKCPVDHKNMSTEELEGMMAQYKRHGVAMLGANKIEINNGPAGARESSSESSQSNGAPAASSSDTSICPVDHKNMTKEEIAAYWSSKKKERHQKDQEAAETVYDVYGQELDKANMMPSTPNQLPAPGQKQPLSTDRIKSSIPKGGGDKKGQTWTYPSPQMFFNSLKRKGKADGIEEADMETVVAVHNDMNETTWNEVMRWENRFHCECKTPKLNHFQGRPHDLSPAARFRVWFRGYPMPFDRHDWVVDRCGEGNARYIIDYYYRDRPDPIEIHVRPALDSPTALFDRIKSRATILRDSMLGDSLPSSSANKTGEMRAPPSIHDAQVVLSGETLDTDEFSFLSGLTPTGIEEIAKDVQTRCEKIGYAFREAGDDSAKMEQANISVNYCMAQTICKPQARGFMAALESGGDETTAYDKMTSCLERFHIMARRALLEASGIAQTGPEFPAGVTHSVGEGRHAASASNTE